MIGRKAINKWIDLIQKKDISLISQLESIYGRDKTQINERLTVFSGIASEFKKIYGEDKEVTFIRAPGRLNTLGMHIDHRGGFVNTIAINREVILCYALRNDSSIRVHNLDPSYGEREFDITSESPSKKIDAAKSWLAWTQEQTDKRRQHGADNDWANKLKSAPVYLQAINPDKKLLGFDAVLDSNIPAGMGLSSSSAIVVSLMEIMIDINRLDITDDKFVGYCGTAEWFVGTRGGSGDHAAIKCGRLGMITHMKTLPRLEIKSYLPFPNGYKLAIFSSGIIADKSGLARQKFNEKTATYEIGEIYVRKYIEENCKSAYEKIIAGRDYLSTEEKRFYLSDVVECLNQIYIYELLQSLPERINRQELLAQLLDYEEFLKEQFATHLEPEDGYQIRSVITYGIAEAQRGKMTEGVLEKSQIKLFGQLMNISHDGDRVYFESPETKDSKRTIDTTKELYQQPGGYDCSIPEIDQMVDISLESGAEGAQISGAGMGGAIMVLVKNDNFDRLVEALRAKYYVPRKMKEDFVVISPLQGAGRL